jgi:hypothetical protein
MKTTKLTVKFFLIISLFASIALADDGQMGSGGYTCNPEVETCDEGQMGSGGFADDGQMGSGGFAEEGQMGSGGFADPVLIFVKDYLTKLFG